MFVALQRQQRAPCRKQQSSQQTTGEKGESCRFCPEEPRFQGPSVEPLHPALAQGQCPAHRTLLDACEYVASVYLLLFHVKFLAILISYSFFRKNKRLMLPASSLNKEIHNDV